MPTISAPQRQAVEQIVSTERARFDTRERRVYSHDTGVLPGPFRLLAGPSLADGVVQPESEEQVVDGLREIALATGGERLPAAIARHEWAERFKPMRLKRLGPSVVPAEVVVPLANLGAVLDDLGTSIKAPLAIEGLSVRGEEIVLLGFIPHDERTLGYTFGYGFVLSAIRAAERHGGRAYSTGRYFSSRAESIFGSRRVTQLKVAKGRNDPQGILNPGKLVFGTGLIGIVIGLAAGIEPLFAVMGPIMPALFPILLPRMLPKVLPHMIQLVESRIEMPEYLRKQLPDLFPEVVANVMPKMLPTIAPKYVPILFNYLRA